jgi:hypothetical protein
MKLKFLDEKNSKKIKPIYSKQANVGNIVENNVSQSQIRRDWNYFLVGQKVGTK